jgi:HlyD family secretion protein
MFKKIINLIKSHKIISLIVIVALSFGGYKFYQSKTSTASEALYTLSQVEKGTIIVSVTGTGQVSASNQVDLKPTVSGDVLSLNITQGAEVKKGDILAKLDASDALKTVRDAQVSLSSAKLALDKLKQPADKDTIFQSENSLTNAKDSLEKLKLSQQTDYQVALENKQKAEDNITKSYEDSLNTISSAFLNLPDIISNLYNLLYSNQISASESSVGGNQTNISALLISTSQDYKNSLLGFQESAINDYAAARLKYDVSFQHYKNTSRYSDRATVDSLLAEMVETVKSMGQAAKSENNYLDAWIDYRSRQNQSIFSQIRTYKTNLSSYISQINSHSSNLLSIQNTIKSNQDAITNAQRDITAMDQNNPLDLAAAEANVKEKESSLAKLKAGTDALDLQSQELSVQQRENSLFDAQQKLADYIIKAPFDGVIATNDIKLGDSVSAGTAIATLITKQRTADISLNEVDMSKIKLGQKVTLTFDAIDGLSLTGEVIEIDSLGTVSQGVVTYKVKIGFDAQDDRVKPGMSVSAAIITQSKIDVLTVSNSAVKNSGNSSYVEILDNPITKQTSGTNGSQTVTSAIAPRKQTIEVGLSNDSLTEIISGLTEGQTIITKTSTSATTAKTTQTNSILQGISGGGNRNAGAIGR